ncbi:GIN domain-containing protein [Winogradskyella litorisediminis]|uniref:GIN domain-containing protein n=1 Tax=Winogradskyella litorisediminis TaxID=1156618 RepID=A0ABW3N5C4_9FLAO
MKKLSLLLMLVGFAGLAQIKGNNNVETRTFPFENVETIKIDLYANITIDNSAIASLEITADSNLFKYIDTEIVDGTIHFSQLKWIAPTQKISIKIGAPNLKRVVHDTHDKTIITNVNNAILRVNANIGKVIIEGKTKELRLGTEIGHIDASNIEAEKVFVNLWDSGTIKVNPTKYLWADVSNDGKLLYTQLPKDNKIKTKSGGMVESSSNYKMKKEDIKWISFKIKNNSSNRNQFIVKGPKADGSYFGYGFPMMPNSKRKEKWSVGTKIYKQNALGFKKLLVIITPEDEGKVVNLFQ